ncbi:MAG: hypothetical protein E7573_01705 [Ruminococcaceae bacterium]|nr:hypothetical protein [Oscillospiraceae bacterium]
MSKVKKIICLLLSVIMVLSLNVPVFANDNIKDISRNISNVSNDELFEITVSTDKSSYKTTNIATINVTVKNVSDESLENVKAQVVFDDLQPVSRKNSTTSKEVSVLQTGECFEFSYKATLNINKHKLNIFQKIFLWFVRLFNGGYTATNNSIDVVEENVTEIKFGNFSANNIIQVGYKETVTSNVSIEEQIEQTEYIQNRIDDFCNSNEYKNSSLEEQISLIKSFLNELEKNGEIKNIIFEDKCVSFDFKNGWGGGIELVDGHAEDCFQSSASSAYIDDTRYITEIITLSENTYSNKFDKWIFSVGTADSCYSIQELANQYAALGVPIERKELATVQTYKEFSGSEFIYIQSHGDTKNGVPVIKTEEFATKEKENSYADSLSLGDVEIWGNAKTNTWYFYIYPSFFENNYKNNKLNDAIVYIGSCNAFGNNNIENYSFYDSFKNAGAGTVIGFCNSVNVSYSNCFAEKLLYFLSLGYTIGDSFTQTVRILGENDIDFWEQYAEYDEEMAGAYPIILGDRDITLFDKQIEGLGTFTANILDNYSKQPIENVAVEIKSNANAELFHMVNTNENGTFAINLPEGNYTCSLIHNNYVRKDFEFVVETDNNIVILNSYYLTPTTNLMGYVIEKETEKPIEGASILLQQIDEGGMIVGEITCSTDANGQFSVNIPVGTYTYTINKLDMFEELYETATGNITVEKADGNILGTVYLTPVDVSLITGFVRDKTTELPISDVTIEFSVSKNGTTETVFAITDSNGYFELNLPKGTYTVSFYHDDYKNTQYDIVVNVEEVEITEFLEQSDARLIIDSGECGENAIYTLYDDGELVVSGYGNMYNSGINCIKSYINKVTVCEGVTSIGAFSFKACKALETVTIPSSVVSIYAEAFSGCENLTDVNIPYGVVYIWREAFFNTAITEIAIPGSVKLIAEFAFQHCHNLKSITIQEGLEEIYKYAFYDCRKLDNIIIPSSVKTIYRGAFEGCVSLKNVELRNGITTIEGYTFYGTAIENITIPSSIKRLYYYEYSGGYSNYISCFFGATNLKSVVFEHGITSIPEYSFKECNSIESIIIPDSVITIEEYAFYNCDSITNITISESITTIGAFAFYDCDGIANISIPINLTSINHFTFYSCDSLISIVIPDSVTSIGESAFYNCDSLTSIVIPDSVTSIGESVFNNCDSLTSIKVDKDNLYYSCDEYGGLFDKHKTTLIQYPIGNDRKEYRVPNSVISILSNAFRECCNLISITVPDGVTNVGANAFRECTNLTSITIPNSVTSIGSYAFDNCVNLKNVIIGDKVTSIEYGTFYGCTNLTSITIPNSVTNIDSVAFRNCINLTDVYYKGTQEEWQLISIDDDYYDYNNSLINATIHYNS